MDPSRVAGITVVPALQAPQWIGVELPKRQPRGLAGLFVLELGERFAHHGVRACLAVYLADRAGAGATLGLWTALLLLAPLFGGYVADRLVGARRSIELGAVLQAAGFLLLAAHAGMTAEPLLWSGLAVVVAGTGFYRPSAPALLGGLYEFRDARRDAGFTVLYVAATTGAVAGTLGLVLVGLRAGWTWSFALAALSMVAALVFWRLRGRRLQAGDAPARRDGVGVAALVLVGGGVAIALGHRVTGYLLAEFGGTGLAVSAGTVLAIVALGISRATLEPIEKQRAGWLILLFLFAVWFWAGLDLAGVALRRMAAHTLGDRTAPPPGLGTTLRALHGGVVLAVGPLLAWSWIRLARRRGAPGAVTKLGMGLVLLGVGFATLAVAGTQADAGLPLGARPLLVAAIAISLGELCFAPIGLALTTRLAPPAFMATTAGAWLLAPVVATPLARALTSLLPAGEGVAAPPVLAMPSWQAFHLLFVGLALATGTGLALLAQVFERRIGHD